MLLMLDDRIIWILSELFAKELGAGHLHCLILFRQTDCLRIFTCQRRTDKEINLVGHQSLHGRILTDLLSTVKKKRRGRSPALCGLLLVLLVLALLFRLGLGLDPVRRTEVLGRVRVALGLGQMLVGPSLL